MKELRRKELDENRMNLQDPPSDFGIRLMEGEEVIFLWRPYRFVRYAVVLAAITIVAIPLIPIAFLWAYDCATAISLLVNQQRRVVWCHGFIGYRIRSVPWQCIADVVISRTLPELLAGISSIDIRDMTGQTQPEMGLVRRNGSA